jgi:Holliday junction resolvase
MRKHARIDANQKKIVSHLRDIGCTVLVTSQLGKGAPDIIVGYKGKNYLIEIKDGEKRLSQQKLTPDEIKFQSEWKGAYFVINNLNDLKDIILQDGQ